MKSKQLGITLKALAIYLTLMGLIFIFFPGVGESVFKISLPDKTLTPLFGQVLWVVALMAYFVSTDVEKYQKFVWVVLFEQIGHVVVMAYLLIASVTTFAQIGPPFIINIIFLVLVWLFK